MSKITLLSSLALQFNMLEQLLMEKFITRENRVAVHDHWWGLHKHGGGWRLCYGKDQWFRPVTECSIATQILLVEHVHVLVHEYSKAERSILSRAAELTALFDKELLHLRDFDGKRQSAAVDGSREGIVS